MLNRVLKSLLRRARVNAPGPERLDRVMRLGAEGRLDEASRVFETLGANERNHPRGRLAAGLIAYQRGDFARAAAYLREAHDGAPGDAAVAANYGEALRAAGRLGEAEAILRAV